MTNETKSRIDEFAETKEVHLLVNILAGLQEEDSISDRTYKRNIFRMLRNVAVHETASFTDQIKEVVNSGYQDILINGRDKVIKVDVGLLIMSLYDMYEKTEDEYYIILGQAVVEFFYSDALDRFNKSACEQYFLSKDASSVKPVLSFLRWQDYMYNNFRRIKTVNQRDAYAIEMFKAKPKIFWKIAVPDMMDLIIFCHSKLVGGDNKDIIQFLKFVYEVREI